MQRPARAANMAGQNSALERAPRPHAALPFLRYRMKTSIGVALTPPTAAASIAGACLLAAAFLPSGHSRDPAQALVAAPPPCTTAREPARGLAAAAPPLAAAPAGPAEADPMDEAAEAAQAAHHAPGASAAGGPGRAASGQR